MLRRRRPCEPKRDRRRVDIHLYSTTRCRQAEGQTVRGVQRVENLAGLLVDPQGLVFAGEMDVGRHAAQCD
jgi:hypothetical protein